MSQFKVGNKVMDLRSGESAIILKITDEVKIRLINSFGLGYANAYRQFSEIK